MTKIILHITKAAVLLFVAILMTSCHIKDIQIGGGIDGSGNVITEKRTINESFTKVEVGRGIEVVIDQASDMGVEVEADDNIVKHITTKVVNNVLVISSDEDIDNATSKTVHIKMPIIAGLEATSGSSIKSNSTLKGTSINVKSSSGSDIDVTLEYDAVDSESSSGSEISLAGKALKLTTSSSSGSEINAGSLIANEIVSEASSGSSATVHPLVLLTAKASSGSSIDYQGSPKTVHKEENSGGDVSKI